MFLGCSLLYSMQQRLESVVLITCNGQTTTVRIQLTIKILYEQEQDKKRNCSAVAVLGGDVAVGGACCWILLVYSVLFACLFGYMSFFQTFPSHWCINFSITLTLQSMMVGLRYFAIQVIGVSDWQGEEKRTGLRRVILYYTGSCVVRDRI